ncbi:protein Abitram [Trichonephila inaurata madagascariensis]|uniref:Protein Abitram n=1 Tax=Trichonephila inaurata madagascariensis TaxID=2747483 RepID=A0A8X6X0L5_9ARAC|nr:protein Abitram [Trichonephila inaurata madagascariensis]
MDSSLDFLEICRINASHPSVTERYFKTRFIPTYDECVLTHSNRLCLITLAPTHPILKENLDVISINFDPVGKVNRLSNKVSGKFKKGGQKLSEKSVLCTVKCNNDCEYTIYSCIVGKLVEVNERLVENPKLLKENPWSEGYIGIILPPFNSSHKNCMEDVS